ncbi:transcriptional regulator, TetR family [Rhodococcoides kroppenstedtii]|uniref:Transcriptional regulator, TetR family n=1 Tax=Rhodococcoides kroppenstedtii TaxID=293050 RepID=A0A1I0UDM3_9NOCA|nr:TetR/AcrR family transcriptional regulator [Rhodococcus kroppenstedtii]MBT1193423.1 TetR/AcrR family transcriptional regulator [Rhodococcus kroppenstedtii]SFA62115.1 transcriptional regulator, TetR family [Rhodococcus kroppenstedtii]
MSARDRVVRATWEVIERGGFEAVSIAAVAQAAGVSRQTVYAHFGSREEMVSQSLEELALEVFGRLRAGGATATSPRGFVIDLLVTGRRAVRDHPVLATLLRLDAANPILGDGVVDEAFPVLLPLLAPLREIDPSIDDEALADIALLVVRLGLSVVIFDDARTRDDDALRAFLRRTLPRSMRADSDDVPPS